MEASLCLQGERVRIESLTERHILPLWDDSLDERVWKYLPKRFGTETELKEVLMESLAGKEKGTEHPLAVYDLALGEYVGSTRLLNLSPEHRNLEIGWTWYKPRAWRTRVNTECKYLLLKVAFEELGMLRVQLKADTRNTRSNEAIRRIGAVLEGELRRDKIMQDGHIRNAYIYSIIREEWAGIKARFESVLLKS